MNLIKIGKFWIVKKEGRVIFMSIDYAQAVEKAVEKAVRGE